MVSDRVNPGDHRDGDPEIGRQTGIRSVEVLGGDPDDRVGPAVEVHLLAHYAVVSAETLLPEAVTQDRYGVRPLRESFLRQEESPEHRPNTEHVEVVRRRDLS